MLKLEGSLHTTVMSGKGQWVEVQIRTRRMDEIAEKGYAAHWKYKESKNPDADKGLEMWIGKVREILEQNDASAIEFVDDFRSNLFQEEVFAFTPKGDLIELPKNATPIDFAYAVHTKIGDTLDSCEINGRGSPLQSILKNGDLVHIKGSKKAFPKLHWLTFAATGKARAAIRRYWQSKKNTNLQIEKKYISSLCIKIPNVPGKLGQVSSLIGFHQNHHFGVP